MPQIILGGKNTMKNNITPCDILTIYGVLFSYSHLLTLPLDMLYLVYNLFFYFFILSRLTRNNFKIYKGTK